MSATQVQKILNYMRKRTDKEWFYAPDFQEPGMPAEYFVGYEASARISDLVRLHPELVEVKKEGKYRFIRLKQSKPKEAPGKAVPWMDY